MKNKQFKKFLVIYCILFFLTILGPIPVGYYYVRNKVLAHHGIISPDDSINVNWFRWWPVKRAQLALYLANPGGAIHFPPNYTETLAADLTLKSNVMLFCDGPCIFTQNAFIVKAPSGTHDFGFTCPFIHSATPAVNSGCTFQGYNGTAASWSIGDSSGFTTNFFVRGISISLDTGAGTGAQGLLLTNVTNSALEYMWFTMGGFSGQKAISTSGTGAFFAGLINMTGIEINSSVSATNNTAFFIGAITNSINIYGGHANMGGSANNSVCIDVNGTASSGVVILGFDCDVAQTGVTVESTANTGVWGFLRGDSGLTNTAAFGAGSFGNMIYTNSNLPYTDSGTSGTNSVINPARSNNKSDVWVMNQSASSLLWNDRADSTSRLIFAQGAAGNTRINAGSGAGQIILNQDSGTAGTLASWSLNKLGQADTVADSSAINTTETIIVKTPALAANRLVAGTHVRMTLTGTCTTTAANTSTFTVRMGTAGTTADTAVATAVTGVAGTTGTAIPFRVVLDFTVRTTGASGTGFITLDLDTNGLTGIVATQSPLIIQPSMSTFNTTTANNILSVSYKSAATTTTSTFKQGVIEIVQN